MSAPDSVSLADSFWASGVWYRWRRALVTGALFVMAFLLALDGRLGATATDGSSDLPAGCIAVECTARPVVGVEDALCIRVVLAVDLTSTFMPGVTLSSVYIEDRVDDTGAVVGSQSTIVGDMQPSRDQRRSARIPISVIVPRGTLTPGRHELRVVTRVHLDHASGSSESRVLVEVVPGSIAARTVKLVRGAVAPIEIYPLISHTRFQVDVPTGISHGRLEHMLAMNVAAVESGTRCCRRTTMVAPRGAIGSPRGLFPAGGIFDAAARLVSGRHVIELRFTPDPVLAFENDAECTEIYGEPIEKELVVDVE
jgi:hypothetical protein